MQMNPKVVTSVIVLLLAATSMNSLRAQVREQIKSLKVGDTAKNFTLQPLEGKKIKLDQLTKEGPVVLAVLRGFPGYQCPACSAQVAELRKHAKGFQELDATVVLIYPGAAENLKQRAEEFLSGKKLPDPLLLTIDPDYGFTELFGLRWEAPAETAYPSTFVLDENRKVKFAKISRTHGDRAKADEVLDVLRAMRAADSKGKEIPQERGTGVPKR